MRWMFFSEVVMISKDESHDWHAADPGCRQSSSPGSVAPGDSNAFGSRRPSASSDPLDIGYLRALCATAAADVGAGLHIVAALLRIACAPSCRRRGCALQSRGYDRAAPPPGTTGSSLPTGHEFR